MSNLFQNKFIRAIIPVFVVLFFLSCQKDLSNEDGPNPGQVADLTTKVNSSVSGFVTDENNVAVLGANVSVGGFNTTTDKYGFFEVRNVQVVKNAAMVTVNQPGYFKGIKTYIATENKAAFFRIKLIPKINVGTINGTSGGNVTLSNGLIVTLPANAVITVGSGAAYTGTVNVAAHWLNPVASDLTETMPGDLRGIATDGTLKSLTTYGMAAVELTGTSGELLQIASGKKATLTLTIPSAILAAAPATIPLWSFDETNGLWKQEGEATKIGNTYVGEVSHFSFWNCDVPANYVHFDCTVKDQAGNPIPYAAVKITEVSNTNNSRYGFTDSSGYVGGLVPDNTQLLIEVFSDYTCGTALYSQTITTSNVAVSLGVITLSISTATATVSGTVTDCNNAPVTNGYIIMIEGYRHYRYALSDTGTFSFNALLCNSTAAVTLVAEDNVGLQQSGPFSVTLTAGANAIGNLQACGISTQQFVTYTVDGGSVITFSAPADSVFHSGNGTAFSSSIGASSNGGNPNGETYFAFTNSGIGAGSVQTLTSYFCAQIAAQTTVNSPANVNITEYGAVGQFIAGNFTCSVTESIAPNTVHNIICSFRVRRNF